MPPRSRILPPAEVSSTAWNGAGVGADSARPDGPAKVRAEFAYAADLRVPDMLHGAVLRSPHASARIRRIDPSAATAIPGVHCVLTQADVPGRKLFGFMSVDQPVLADGVVRYHGEPVAIVAADTPDIARAAAAAIRVDFELLDPVVDPAAALAADAPRIGPEGNLVRHVRVRRGSPTLSADTVVRGEYRVGRQDAAFLDPEAGLAIPVGEGAVDLYVASQWTHSDHGQVAASLGLPPDRVRLIPAGIGGAFGGREDLSVHLHASMLALRTGRPVRLRFSGEDSFLGHPHRHPAVLRYEHGADADGRLRYVRADILLDGGAYGSSSAAVAATVATCSVGPYEVPDVHVDVRAAYTNNPPSGALRGFGAVQPCFAYESQMDLLAEQLGISPARLRVLNAVSEGSALPTGQVLEQPAPIAELVRRVEAMPLPAESGDPDVVRGIGYGVGMKNVGFIEGYDDYSTARVRLEVHAGHPQATVTSAAAEVGQGVLTVLAQIARTELGVERAVVTQADTTFGSAGPSAASRQTYMAGGAVQAACEQVRDQVLAIAAHRLGMPSEHLSVTAEVVTDEDGVALAKVADLLADDVVEQTVVWRHRPTFPLDATTGQGASVYQFAFAAHRAVVDVDVELGTVRVVELAVAQDVGKAMNPDAVLGQIHGGCVQGLGLALMEELVVCSGRVLNPSLAGYLLPTAVDVPAMRVEVLELPDPHAPYGLRGAGEAATISVPPAIVAAIRAAAGRPLRTIPIHPRDIALPPAGEAP